MQAPEITYLTWTAVLTGVIWMPYIVNRIIELGPWPALRNPDPDGRPKAPWAVRAEAAHRNAVENLVVFAPLAIAVHVTGASTETTALAAMVFFWARLAHLVIYVVGVPVARTLAFFVGFLCQMTMAAALLGW